MVAGYGYILYTKYYILLRVEEKWKIKKFDLDLHPVQRVIYI